jgi:hypothetical protein
MKLKKEMMQNKGRTITPGSSSRGSLIGSKKKGKGKGKKQGALYPILMRLHTTVVQGIVIPSPSSPS